MAAMTYVRGRSVPVPTETRSAIALCEHGRVIVLESFLLLDDDQTISQVLWVEEQLAAIQRRAPDRQEADLVELLDVRNHVMGTGRSLAEDVLAAFDRVQHYLTKIRHPH